MIINIYATSQFHEQIQSCLQREERLEELVHIADSLEEKPVPSANNLLIKNGEIAFPIDWYNVQPPFILPETIELTPEHLLGLIFAKLNNYEKAYSYLKKQNPGLLLELDFINRLQQGIAINPDELASNYSPFEEYRLMHNQAILRHYATPSTDHDFDQNMYFYSEAITSAPNEEYRAYTARQLALLLIDGQQLDNAVRLLKTSLRLDVSKIAQTELKQTLCQAWMSQLSVPYDPELLENLKTTLWEVLQVYEKQERTREQALLLTDAGIIANYSESWSESLGYFNKAIALFESEDLPELTANVQYHKGILLFTWAKKGNSQFFRPAAETFQEAVKVFNRHEAPEVYADIQHHLGMVYAEIPDEQKKKGIWAAVSSSAFQEALQIYTKTQHPYEYATVCNHYGNALVNYPEAKLSDNIEKALYYYQEALAIRRASSYPTERCLTLFNYLEAQWYLGMPEDQFDEQRYQDMVDKAQEIKELTEDPELVAQADEHLQKLSQLKAAYY